MDTPKRRSGRKQGRRKDEVAMTAVSSAPSGTDTVVALKAGAGDTAKDSLAGRRTVLSGRLSRCSPLFAPTSDMVFCACSSSVLALSVDTGEELFRLVGHTNDVTGMLLLPKGSYEASARNGRGESGRRRLLTSSLDGKLRLWDISSDLMSLEGELERCLRVFRVGRPVYHLYLGRKDANGSALDVILVTRGGIGNLRGMAGNRNGEGGRNQADEKDGTVPSNGQILPLDGGKEDMDVDGSDHEDDETDHEESDGEDTEEEDAEDNDKKGGDPEVEGVDKKGAGDRQGTVVLDGGAGGKSGLKPSSKRWQSGSNQAAGKGKSLRDWQAVRCDLAKGTADKILMVNKRQGRWIGAIAPCSPIRQHADEGRHRGGGEGKACASAPVLIVARERVLMAVDAGTGHHAMLLKATGPVTSVVVGDDGQQLITGHVDGSMSQWQRLYQRIGAAFQVSGFENAGRQPSTDMHWHSCAVQSMNIAPDGVQLFSGGKEGVLAQWNMAKGSKAFIPRLGATVQGLAVSPSQEHVAVTTMDNAVSLVGLAAWDVMWQLRGLALPSGRKGVDNTRKPLRLTLEPRRGLLVCNGRAGHLQFYNMANDCLEASTEVVRFNRISSSTAFVYGKQHKKGNGHLAQARAPVVEHVAFSTDGKRMVAVASRQQFRSRESNNSCPAISFWRLAHGADPYGGGYSGSYTGAGPGSSQNTGTSRNAKRGGSGTSGHWAPDTNVENPHGVGTKVLALEYHPRNDVAVSAGEDGTFNLWGVKRDAATVDTLAAVMQAGGDGGKGRDQEKDVPATHWACTLSVRYKTGLSASAVSFCSDGSVLAVSYTPTAGRAKKNNLAVTHNHNRGQGVVTLWSLETATLLSTLLPPRTPLVKSPRKMQMFIQTMGFLTGSGRIFAAGIGYAAVWDLVSEEATPLWQYRLGVLAATTADSASVRRSGKAGVEVPGRGFGDVAVCISAASLSEGSNSSGSVVLLLNSANPTPLHAWRLTHDTITCVKLLLADGSSNSREGVLCVTNAGQLLLLSVSSEAGEGRTSTPGQKVGGGALGVVHMIRHGASTPALSLSTAGKRQLLEVDLASSDPALMSSGKRPRGGDDSDDDDTTGAGHTGGREAALRSGQRASDILDPSSINLAPVPDLFQAFMKTLLKPAPKPQNTAPTGNNKAQNASRQKGKSNSSGARSGKGNKGKSAGAVVSHHNTAVMDKKLLAALAAKMRGGSS